MIESVNNDKIKKYSKLLLKKYRDETNMYLVSTDHLVKEALENKLVVEVFLLEGCNNLYGKVTYVNESVMRKLTNLNTIPSVIAVVKKRECTKIEGNILLLDDIQDPGNLGTIIRSAVAFNISTLILSNNTVDLYNEKVIRATEGMLYNINIIKGDLLKIISKLKLLDYKILGTKVDGGTNVCNIKPKKYALIIGNEGKGISKNILNLCDDYIYIQMEKKCESLNVGVATSIIIYELNK